MGTWSTQAFGNDTAGDWAYGLVESKDLSLIEAALDTVLDAGAEYLESPEAMEAIAAIEVLAKCLGRGTQSDAYTEDVDAWVAARKLVPPAALLRKVGPVIDRILADDSELAELWAESEDASAWIEGVKRLRSAACA